MPTRLWGELGLVGLLKSHLNQSLLLVSLYIYLALKSLFICKKVIKVFDQLSLNNFLFLLSFIVANKKDTVYCITILVEYDSIVKLSIGVLALINHALYRLEIAKEIKKPLSLYTFVTINIQ